MAVEPADATELAVLERDWTGFDRLVDHRLWGSQPGAEPIVVRAGEEPVAIGYGRLRQSKEVRVLGRLAVRPDVEPLAPTLAAIVHASRGGPVEVAVPGPHPALPVLLGAGFRITDRDEFMASDLSLVDPARLLADPGML
jgi:hypothetical protein